MAFKAAFRTSFKVCRLLLALYSGDHNSLQYSCTTLLLWLSLRLLFIVYMCAVAQEGSGLLQLSCDNLGSSK